MKEKPIMFSTPMVKAILEGRKTMTRRVIRPRYRPGETGFVVSRGLAGTTVSIVDEDENTTREESPKYWPDDILWVRETWAQVPWYYDDNAPSTKFLYRADDPGVNVFDPNRGDKWKPSIFMPREAARLFLKVKSVRVERLRDITESDATLEGMVSDGDEAAVIWFSMLWDRLNAKRVDAEKKPVYSWESNPWVWVIEFERAKK